MALFVEAGHSPPPPRGATPLLQIWGRLLAEALGLRALSPIVPISKRHLVAMDPDKPAMSGAGEGLDQLIGRKLKGAEPFDAAIVAWDLIPAWSVDAPLCRWQETEVTRRVRGDLKTNKDGWGAHLLEALLEDEDARGAVTEHPICRRLVEIAGP